MLLVPAVRAVRSAACPSLLNPLRALVRSALMQDQRRRASLAIDLERDLRVDHLQEEVPLAFWKDLEFRLARRLDKQAIPFTRHRHTKFS